MSYDLNAGEWPVPGAHSQQAFLTPPARGFFVGGRIGTPAATPMTSTRARLEIPMVKAVRGQLSRGPLGQPGAVRLWENRVGLGWTGQFHAVTRTNLQELRGALRPGDMVIRSPRALPAGFETGSGDLLGFRCVQIRPEHVGQVVAVFCSLEGKRPVGGWLEPRQRQWRENVAAAGGFAGVFRSEEEARKILETWPGV